MHTHPPGKALMAIVLIALAAVLMAGCATTPPQPTATPQPVEPTIEPTPEVEDLWASIQQSGKMTIGTSADYPPFESYDENFRLTGFDIALMEEIGRRLGVEVEFNDFAFDGLGGAVSLGQVDAAIAAIAVTPERQQLVDFSNVYYIGEDAILVGESVDVDLLQTPEEVSNLKLGVQSGTVYEQFAEQQLVDTGIMPETNLFVYSDVDRAIRDLRAGRITAVLLDKNVADEFAAQGGLRVAGEGLTRQRLAIALPKGQDALRRVINQALTQLQNEGVVAELAERYLNVQREDVVVVPTATPEPPTPTPAPAQPTSTPQPPARCVDGAAWVADLSYDDRNMTAPPVLQPGQIFVKGWRIRNTGTCTWDSAYYLDFVRGNTPAAQMGGGPIFVRGTVPPGATYDFTVQLTAPAVPGTYQGFWQMTNDLGQRFGETVWVGIRVPAPPTPTPAPTPTPVANVTFTVNTTNIQQGQCVTFYWSVNNVQAVYFYSQGQNWQDHGVGGQGSQQECPQQTTTYYLRVVFRDGTVTTSQITINVTQVANRPNIVQFSADPPQVAAGQCLNLFWEVQNQVTNVVLRRNNNTVWDGAPVKGNWQDCPPSPGTYSYQLTATGPGGTSQAVVYVNATQPSEPTPTPVPTTEPPTPTPIPQPMIYGFSADPAQIQQGQCVTLAWTTGGGTQLTRVRKGDAVLLDNGPQNGNIQDCPSDVGTVVYTLEASGGGTSVFQEAAVNVTVPIEPQ